MEGKYKKYVQLECSIMFFEEDAIRTSGVAGIDIPFQDGNDFGYNDAY